MGNSKSSGKRAQKAKSRSIQDFRYIEGRRYHNELTSSYLLSSDLEEIDRQQLQHYYCKHIFKCNMSAPVRPILIEGCKVLDIGCGAGIWILELSTEYPKSEFFGIDMSPVFPTQIKPVNSNFIKANVLNGLPFNSEEFDYIHLSFMNVAFNDDQWQNIVIPEVVRVLKPNGWLEFYEVDIVQFNGGPLVERLTNSVRQLFYNACLNPRSINLFKQWLSSYECLRDIDEIVAYPFIGEWKGRVMNEKINKDNAGKYEIIEEHENSDVNNLANLKSKDDVELGILLKQIKKMYYTNDSEHLSKCAGVSKEEYLDIIEECFESEMTKYDTRMKYVRVICRKEI